MYRLQHLTPRTESDRLILAHAQLMLDPGKALGLIETVPRINCSPAGLLIRASATKYDTKLRDKALRDYEYAQFLYRDSQFVISLRIWAITQAIVHSRREGRHEDARRYAQEGEGLADKFEAAPGNPFGDWSRSFFYETCGENEKAFHALRRVGRHAGTYTWCLAVECLRRNDYANALHEFELAMYPDHERSKYVRIAKAHLYVCACISGADERRPVLAKMAWSRTRRMSVLGRRHLSKPCGGNCKRTRAPNPAPTHGPSVRVGFGPS